MFQPLFLCAAKKKPLAVKRKRQRGICVGTNYTSLALPQAAGLVRFVVPPFPTRIASLDSRGSPFFGIPLKTTKGKVIPLPWIYLFSKIENCCNVATAGGQGRPPLRFIKLKMFRISYVKYSTGANIATPHGVSYAQETQFYGRPKGVRTTARETTIRKM